MNVFVYSGERNPERPVAFDWEGQRCEVKVVLAESRQPEGWKYNVRTQDGRIFQLFFAEINEEWTILPQA